MRLIWLLFVFFITIEGAYAQENTEKWKSFCSQGLDFYNQDKFVEALLAFEEAEKLFPTDTFALVMGAECAYMLENYDLVGKKLENAISFQNKVNDVRWYNYYLLILKDYQQDYANAWQLVEKMKVKFGSKDSTLKALEKVELEIYLRSKQTEKAESLIQKMISANPQDAKLYYNLAVLREEQGKSEEAVALYEQTLELDDTFFNPYYNLGSYHYS
jgi:tetratricopeptide (TPR) repeat protein